jgi:hypothetical protein
MVSVIASSVVDRGFEPRSDQTKYNEIGIFCLSDMHVNFQWGDDEIHFVLDQHV